MTRRRGIGQAPGPGYPPSGGLCQGTAVLTLDGALPVEYLEPGDRLVTRSGACKLRRVISCICTDFSPVLVRAGGLGRGRPTRDMLLPGAQIVHLRDAQAQLICRAGQTSLPVAQLINGSTVRRQQVPGAMRLWHLEFETPQVIFAQGLELIFANRPATTRPARTRRGQTAR